MTIIAKHHCYYLTCLLLVVVLAKKRIPTVIVYYYYYAPKVHMHQSVIVLIRAQAPVKSSYLYFVMILITRLVSLDSVLNDTQFSHVSHFEFWCTMLYFMNTTVYQYEAWHMSPTPHPTHMQKVLGQHHLVVKNYYRNANSFFIICAYCH